MLFRSLCKVEQAFTTQKRFSSDAAHELKTPLAVLKTNLEVLNMEQSPTLKEYKNLTEVFKRQTDRMITLVDDLFAMSENKSSDLSQDVEINQIIQEIKEELAPQLSESNISITTDVENSTLKGNREMLKRGFLNLVENAIKYNHQNGTITVTGAKQDEFFILKVSDTGIGIEEEFKEDIFNAFYRIDQSRSRKTAGAGLGLAITKDIIQAHNGTIKHYILIKIILQMLLL